MSRISVKVRRQQKKMLQAVGLETRRNDSLFDIWSITHLLMGVLFGWLMDPFIALVLLVLWEPLEILVLSPLLRKVGIIFGYETIRNSLSDIFFDTLGVIIGTWLLAGLVTPPFSFFSQIQVL